VPFFAQNFESNQKSPRRSTGNWDEAEPQGLLTVGPDHFAGKKEQPGCRFRSARIF
jgi:hypothetical protein